jgi:hypothetical protein
MNRLITCLFISAIIVACKADFERGTSLSQEQQHQLLTRIVRYSERRPALATDETFLDTTFNSHYELAVNEYDVRRYFQHTDGRQFFLVTRQARSITAMRVAIGGYVKRNNTGDLIDYVEGFRTWKMSEDSLNNRAFELFDKMVSGEDLNKYGPKYQGDRYIEFPDARFYFDKKRKRWVDSVLDSLYNR